MLQKTGDLKSLHKKWQLAVKTNENLTKKQHMKATHKTWTPWTCRPHGPSNGSGLRLAITGDTGVFRNCQMSGSQRCKLQGV